MYFLPSLYTNDLHTKDDYINGNPDQGITQLWAFNNFELFNGPSFFGLDKMCLIGHGIAKALWRMFEGQYGNTDFLRLSNVEWQTVANSMQRSQKSIPMAFYGIEKNIAIKSEYFQVVDWIDFLLYVMLTIVIEVVDDDADVKALVSLVRACTLIQKWEITETEVSLIESSVCKWQDHLLCQVGSH